MLATFDQSHQGFANPEGVQNLGLPNTGSARTSSAEEVNVSNNFYKPDAPDGPYDDHPLEVRCLNRLNDI